MLKNTLILARSNNFLQQQTASASIFRLTLRSFSAVGADGKVPGPIEKKLWKNALEATRDMKDGATILSGGFGLCGIPENLIKATAMHGVKDLTLISNECGSNDYGLSLLLRRN